MSVAAVIQSESGRLDEGDAFVRASAYWRKKVSEYEALPEDGEPTWRTNGKTWKLSEAKKRLAGLDTDWDIRRTIRHISGKFVYLGQLLKKVKDEGLSIYIMRPGHAWEGLYGGYGSFEEYVREAYGLSKTTAYTLIGVYETFGTGTGELAPAYAKYSYSALAEMLPLSADARAKVTPEMTVKEIRALKAAETAVSSALEAVDEIIMPAVQTAAISVSPVPVEAEAEAVRTSGKIPALALRNKPEREQWLRDYRQHCRLWVDVAPLGLKVYRYDFRNGVYMAVTEYGRGGRTYQLIADTVKVCDSFCIGSYYSPGSGLLTTAVIDFLTRYREDL